MKKSRKIWHVLIFIAVFAVAIAVVMFLWNALIPSIIGWAAINYWQSAGLIILCKLLFGGFGHFGHRHGHGHGHGFPFHKNSEEHARMHDTLRGMSRDERREFIRERMSRGFGDICDKSEDASKSEN